MNTRSLWFVGTSLLTLGGCIIGYPLDKYDPDSSSSESATASSTGNGGMGAAGSTSSSSGGGSGGQGGMQCPTLDNVDCNARESLLCNADCPVHVASTRPSALNDQVVTGVAVDSKGNIAIGGYLVDSAFSLNANPAIMVPGMIPPEVIKFTEGFVGIYDSNAVPLFGRAIDTPALKEGMWRSIADISFNSKDELVIAYSEFSPTEAISSFVQKYKPGSSNDWTTSLVTPVEIFSNDAVKSFPNAMSIDKTDGKDDIYVLGVANAADINIACGMTMYTLFPGMFVAKLATNGKCLWIRSFNNLLDDIEDQPLHLTAIYAEDAETRGVWITGTTNKKIPLASGKPDLEPDTGANPPLYGFVIGLDHMTGMPTSGIKLEGNVSPKAIAVLGVSAGKSTVALAGGLTGMTGLSDGSPNASSFVSILEIMDNGAANSNTFTHKTTLLTSAGNSTEATAMVVRGNRIHIAGTVSKGFATPTAGPYMVEANLAPYIATVSTETSVNNAPSVVGIQVFASELAQNKPPKVTMVASMNQLFLASTWSTSVNVSTRHAPSAGALSPAVGDVSYDVFFAKYSIAP